MDAGHASLMRTVAIVLTAALALGADLQVAATPINDGIIDCGGRRCLADDRAVTFTDAAGTLHLLTRPPGAREEWDGVDIPPWTADYNLLPAGWTRNGPRWLRPDSRRQSLCSPFDSGLPGFRFGQRCLTWLPPSADDPPIDGDETFFENDVPVGPTELPLVPEPASLLLVGAGLVGITWSARKHW